MPDVTIIGAGLAGMVAGLRLAQRGCKVTIYESDVRTGGKAGSPMINGHYEDHGYHIFPAWYLNTWSLIKELGIYENFKRNVGFLRLTRGHQNNLTFLPFFAPSLLMYYSIIDLISRGDKYLGNISIYGFLHSRFYYTQSLEFQYSDLVLKALSDPSYDVSAVTVRDVYQQNVRYPTPGASAVTGTLQETWVLPIQKAFEAAGGTIKLQHTLTKIKVQGKQITHLTIKDPAGQSVDIPVERVVMTIPLEQLRLLLDDAIFDAAPDLFNLNYLEVAPQASLNVYLKKKIPNLPPQHVSLVDSAYAQTFIDISQLWSGFSNTVIQSLASNMVPLSGLSDEKIESEILNELMAYLPFTHDDIERIVLQTNVNSPLFMNNVGSAEYRPNTRTDLTNLYMAGDYCLSHVDLASMENAVTTGLMAAEAVRSDLKINNPVPILKPALYPRWVMALLRFVLTPFALIAKLIDMVIPSKP